MKGIFKTMVLGANNTEVEICYEQLVPFVPCSGMMVAPQPGGEFLEVESVFWDAERPLEIQIYAHDPAGLDPVYNMTLKGWKVV
jgi:hypothetical protein